MSGRSALTAMLVATAAMLLIGAARRPEAGPRAHAAGGEPTILLRTMTVDAVIQATATEPPAAPHLGYGVLNTMAFGDAGFVFDEVALPPSALERQLSAYVGTDADAALLASSYGRDLTEYESRAVIHRFDERTTYIRSGSSLELRLPPGAQAALFKMTVRPFSIEKVFDRDVLGELVSMYRVVADGPLAVIEAYGPPPPGDADCDAAADSTDALLVLQRGARLLAVLRCEKAADVFPDGSIDARDAQRILQFVAGLIRHP